jgi:hypothetical protein
MRTRLLASVALLSSTLAIACSPATDSAVVGGGSGNGGSGAGGPSQGGASGAGGATATTTTSTTSTTTTTTSSAGGAGQGGAKPLDCKAPTADCNVDKKDGCEVDLDTSPENCGACGKACPVPPHAKATCSKAACGSACELGYAECNQDAKDGCETDTASDPANCGACANVCPDGPGAKGACVKGGCVLACAKGTGDCNLDPKDGCEHDLASDSKNCGACGNDCKGAPCVQGACACASETQNAELVPLDLFIMLDQSASMAEPVKGGATKWAAVTTALKAFFADPKSKNVGVGIQYFALPYKAAPPVSCKTDADCNGYGPCLFQACSGGDGKDSCDATDYATADVEIATLDANQVSKLSASVDSHQPSTATPTAPALAGAIQHASVWAQANPTHTTIVVLATDGEPSECTVHDVPAIKAIAANGVAASPSIKTFVIGVGPSLAAMNDIAVGGGTGQAFLVDTGGDVVAQLAAALGQIQKAAIGCEYAIPQPQGQKPDLTKVNVEYTPGVGSPKIFGNVADVGACDPVTGGWYYDDPKSPQKIILCPASCSLASSDANGKVDVLLGCETQHQ